MSEYKNFPNFKNIYEWCISCGGGFFTKVSLYDEIYSLMLFKNPNLKKYSKYDDDYYLSLDYIPEYLDGEEVSIYIEKEIFNKIPLNFTKAQKKKYIKEECKKLFHIEGNKFPRWAQSCEWPLRNGIPCKYIKQRKIGEMFQYYFLDVITNEEIIIEQYY